MNDNNKKKTKKHVDKPKPSSSIWAIDADAGLNDTQLKEAYKLLDSGSKPYGVASLFGFHRSKIKRKES